jgi:DNA modification methylase
MNRLKVIALLDGIENQKKEVEIAKSNSFAGGLSTNLANIARQQCSSCSHVPPMTYWGLRDYGVDGQLGLEATPELYVEHMVAVFREVRRVMRPDATCWINLGDSYAQSSYGSGGGWAKSREGYDNAPAQDRSLFKDPGYQHGLKNKDLVGIPWRVAFALQADGWWLRQDIVWAKLNPMPESVTDRCTKSHEYLFLLTKNARYYYDAEAIKEPISPTASYGGKYNVDTKSFNRQGNIGNSGMVIEMPLDGKRNRRDVWFIATQPYREAHFATMPEKLVEPCILAGTSEKGCCPKCGKAWVRAVESKRMNRTELPVGDPRHRPNTYNGAYGEINGKADAGYTETITLGWRPSCTCDAGDPIPCVVLDPFNGAGTVGKVAVGLGRSYVGIELNPEYIAMTERRLNGVDVRMPL